MTKTSVSSGNWNSGATWNPSGAPGASDNVVISAGHTVTYSTSSSFTTTGAMTITGNLSITPATAVILTAGSLTGSGNIAMSGGAHTFRAGTNNLSTTYSGVISGGTGRFEKMGTGVFTLTGAHTFGGSLTIGGGTLILSGAATLGSGGTYAGNIVNNGGVFNIASSSNQTLSGVLSGSGSVLKESTGIVTLTNTGNIYSGTTTIIGGELRLNPTGNATFASQVVLNGGTLSTTGIAATRTITSSSTFRLTGNSGLALGAAVHSLSFANSSAQSWTSTALLSITGWTGSAASPGTAGRVFFGNNAGGLTANQLGQTTLVGYPWDPILLGTGEMVAANAPNTYTWNATSGTADWQAAGSWTPSRNTPQLTDVLYFSNGGSSVASNVPTGTMDQLIMSNNTAVTLQAAASGNTLTIQGNAGTDLSIPAGSSLTLGNGANALNLSFSGINHVAQIGGSLILGNGNTGSTFNTANSTTTVSGSGTLNNGATLSGNVVNNGQVIFSRGDSYTYAGVISGSGGMTKTGAGTLTLTGNHTFTGNITLSAGTLSVGSGGTSGALTGNIDNSAALVFNRSDNSEYPGDLTGTGTLSKLGAGTLSITGDLMHSGATTISAGILSIGNGGSSGTLSAGTSVVNNAGIVFNRSDNSAYDGVITGTGTLTKLGSGILVLAGANAYTGSTNISAGALELGASEVLPNGSNIILSGGSLRTGNPTGFTETVGTLTLTANSSIVLGSGVHALNFAPSNAVSWTAGMQLSISGWQGVANAGGIEGQVFFGNFPTTLTAVQLGQISFVGFLGTPLLLSTGELVPPVAPLNYVWNATSGTADWQASGSWTPARISPSASDILRFTNGGSSTASNVPTQTISQLVVSNSTRITLLPSTSGNTLTLQGGSGADLFTQYGSGLTLGSSSSAMNLSFVGTGHLGDLQGDMTLNGTSVFNTANSTTTITGNNSVAVSLRPALYAMGSNNLSGNIINNGILEFRGTTHIYSGIISGTGILNLRGTPTVAFTGTNTYTGASWLYGGLLSVGAGGTTGSIVSDVFSVGGNLEYNRSNNVTYSGTISLNASLWGRLNKRGAGVLTLSGSVLQAWNPGVGGQSYIYMYDGGIRLGRANVLADSMYFYIWTPTNAYLDLNGFSETVGGSQTVTGGFYVTNGVAGAVDTITWNWNAGNYNYQPFWIQNGSGTVRLQIRSGNYNSASNQTHTGGTFVASGATLYLYNTGQIQGNIVNNGTVQFSEGNWTFGGVISGPGRLTYGYDVGHVLTLSNRNTFTGGVRIAGGTIRLGTNNALSNFCSITLTRWFRVTATLRLGTGGAGITDTVGPLMMEGSGTIALGAGNHSLVFANSSGMAWNQLESSSVQGSSSLPPVALTITGWAGTPGSSGTAGRVFFSSATGLTAQQLSQVVFSNFPNNPAMLLATGELVPGPAPANYTWVATTGTADWQNPLSWSPARNTPQAADILQFSAGGTSTASNVPTQTIAQFLMRNNTNVTLLAAADGNTLTIAGSIGTDFSMASGTVLTLGSAAGGSNAMRLVQNSSSVLTASIGGTLNLAAGNTGNTYDAGNYYTLVVTGGVINTSGTLLGFIQHNSGSGNQINLNRNDNYTLSANLNYDLTVGTPYPTGRIVKNGAGTCTVTGNLISWGGITISSGTLMIGNGGTSGSFGFTVGTYVNNGVLIWNKSSNDGLWGGNPGVIMSGTGSLVKQGTGILSIFGNNTFSGGTTVSAGVLNLGGGTASSWSSSSAGLVGNIVNNAQVWFTHSAALTFSNTISGTGLVDKRSANVLTFTGANTYTGNTIIRNGGTIQLGNNNRISDASNLLLDRGIFRTGATTGFSETLGTLAVLNNTVVATNVAGLNSTIALGTGVHTLRFANSSGVTWDPGVSLTITGWTGTVGTAGTAGRIFFGTDASGLTATQLSRITMSGYLGNPILLSTGELVPTPTPPPSYRWLAASASADWQNPASWTPARNTPAVTDILVFNTAGTFAATNVPTQTIERMLVSSNMTIRLEAAGSGSTLTIRGSSACGQLEVASNCVLELGLANGNIPMNLRFSGFCNTANIAGGITINDNAGGSTFNTDSSTTYMSGGSIAYGEGGNFQGDIFLSSVISGFFGVLPSATLNLRQTSDLTFSTSRIKGSGNVTLSKATGPLSTLSLDGSANAGIYYTINLVAGTLKPLTATALPDSNFTINFNSAQSAANDPCVLDMNGYNLNVGRIVNYGGTNTSARRITNSGSNPVTLTLLGMESLQNPSVGPSWYPSVWRSGSIEDGIGGLSLAFFPRLGAGNCWNSFNEISGVPNLSYTGTTTIYAGAYLQITTTASPNIINHGRLIFDVNSGTDRVYTGTISGTGEVIKDAEGVNSTQSYGGLTLTGTGNNYTGTTWLGRGKLELGASEVIPDGTTLVLGGFTSTTQSGYLNTAGYSETAGKLRLNASAYIQLGSGSDVHTLRFASSASETWATARVLTIANWQGTAGSSGTAGRIFFGSDATGLTAAQLSQISFLGFMGTGMLLPTGELVPAPVNPTYVWNPTTGSADFQVASNWTPARTVPGLDDLLGFTAGGSSIATNVPTQSIGRLIVDNNTAVTLQPSGAGRVLTLQGGAGSDLVVGSGSTLTIGSGANSLGIQYFGSALSAGISGTLNISSSNTANFYNSSSGAETVVNATGTLNAGGTLAGNVTNYGSVIFSRPSGSYIYSDIISGTGRLEKQGSSVLNLPSAQTYSGETLISGGTLQPGAEFVFPFTSALSISSGATLDLNSFSLRVGSLSGAGTVTNTGASDAGDLVVGENGSSTTFSGIIQNGTSAVRLVKTGEGNLNLSGNNTYTGGTIVSQGVLSVGAGGSSGAIAGNVDMAAFGWSFPLNNPTLSFNRSDNITFSGVISGSGTVTKQGANTLSLTGDHTFTGSTICNQGTLSIGNGGTTGSLADGEIINDATVAFNRSNTYTFNGFISGAGLVEKRGAGTLILTNNHTYTGGTNIIGGTLSLGNNTASGSVAGDISIQTTGSALVFNRSNDLTFPGVISSNLAGTAGTMTKLGSGVLFLTGANTYTGNTIVSAGTLSIGAGGTTGSVASSNITNNSVVIFDRSDAITYTRVISGPGALRKQGAGTLTLSGVNSYTGATFITAGTLALATGGERISNSSRVELSGGTLRTAGNPFTENVNTLTLGASSTIALQGTGVHDLRFSSSVLMTWSAGTTLTISNWQGLPGASGTGGRIFFGTTSGTLTAQQLSQIVFSGFSGTPVLLSTGELVPRAGFNWVATSGSANWQTPSSWNPARTSPISSDILVFPNGGSSIATNVPSQTVAQILMYNNTAVTLEAASSGNTLTLQGSTGNDLSIPAGSSLTIGNGANAMGITFTGTGNATNVDGTLTLSNANSANTYNTTNSTTLITGTFNIGGPVTGNFANNGLVNFTRTDASVYTGIISGTGAVTQQGAGALTLAGANTYSGITTVQNGSSLTIGNGSTAGSIVSASNIVNNGTLTFDRSDDQTYSGSISGTGTVNKSGANTLTLDAPLLRAGNLNVNSGSLALGTNGRMELSGNFNLSIGTLIHNNSTLAFTGSGNSTISGNLSLYNLEMNKTNSTAMLSLGSNIGVGNELNMQAGDLDLNAYQLDLGSTGSLINETAANFVTGTSGGSIRAVRNLNAPSSVNVGGLGAVLSSAQDLGSTEIIRKHNQAVVGFNYGMNRRYEIHPTNNSGLDATLVFRYFDGELSTNMGNITEADLVLWRFNGSTWEFQGGTVDVAANTVTKTGIPQFSEWTSGSFDFPLSLTLRDLKVNCGDKSPELTWRSLKEENTSRFEVEISSDGNKWERAGVVLAAGNSESLKSYNLDLDKLGRSSGYVRLVLHNEDGSREIFGPLAVNCRGSLDEETFSLYPNPSRGFVSLDLKSVQEGSVQVRIFNTLGAEVYQQVHQAESGSQIRMDLGHLPAGIYQVEATLEAQNQRSVFRLVVQ